MSRKIIEIVQVLVDRIEKGGYQQRAREENAFDLNRRLTEAEGWVAHWKQARQEAHEAGELMKAEIESLRKELANAQRELSEQSMVANVETQQDAAAWQQELDAARAEITTLQGASAADDQRLRDAEERIWPGMTWGCDAPDKMADEILHLRQWANKHYAELVKARDAAHVTILAQRAGIERLQAFVAEIRQARDNYRWPDSWDAICTALAELDAETEPAPVAEPLDAEGGA